jgi:hypothetical protein
MWRVRPAENVSRELCTARKSSGKLSSEACTTCNQNLKDKQSGNMSRELCSVRKSLRKLIACWGKISSVQSPIPWIDMQLQIL